MSESKANALKPKIITSIVVLFAIALLVVGVDVTKSDPSATTSTAKTTTSAPAGTGSSASTGSYKDGTYMAAGSYSSPGGTQNVQVSVTLAGNKITDSSVKGDADSGVAQYYQSSFVKDYKQYVTGKSIDNVKLSRVSGSSLTSKGFNAALQKIKDQAES